MSTIVADASVAVTWLLPEREGEQHVEQALGLLRGVKRGGVKLYQPPHWLVEAAAVVTRLRPAKAEEKIEALHELAIEIVAGPSMYVHGSRLSHELSHHLFDTLYHAVALETDDAVLVTADERYYWKAHERGAIVRLAEYEPRD